MQDYPGDYELLFAVASPEDPVCKTVRRLMERYRKRQAELIICQPILGANAKVSSLCYLEKRAHYEHLVLADQDVLVEKDFLLNLVPSLTQPDVGLVNCFYIMAGVRGLPMRIEALGVNADFWSHVLQGNMLKPMHFALGAVIGTTKSRMKAINGFEALLDYLADDYELGNRIAKTGARVEICPFPVECRSAPQGARSVWRHQLRWARTIRVCQPAPYFFSILSNGTLWPFLAFISHRSLGLVCFASALLVRVATASSNYNRLTERNGWRAGLLAPMKDLIQVGIWASAFFGDKITWRGERFRVDRGGKLTPAA